MKYKMYVLCFSMSKNSRKSLYHFSVIFNFTDSVQNEIIIFVVIKIRTK